MLHRRSIRLPDYDYRRAGAYFVTICTRSHQCLFGEIVDGVMLLNDYGEIVANEWLRTAAVRPNVVLDAYVVMPNHVHGIMLLQDGGLPAASPYMPAGSPYMPAGSPYMPAGSPYMPAERPYMPTERPYMPTERPYRFGRPVSNSLGAIVGQFKSVVTKRINNARATPSAGVWQRNYYEHVIRNEEKLNRIRHYIEDNPGRWSTDPENPGRVR